MENIYKNKFSMSFIYTNSGSFEKFIYQKSRVSKLTRKCNRLIILISLGRVM